MNALEAEPLPDDRATLEMLIADHREFMENTSRRQNEVDRVCKARQIKSIKDARKISKVRSPAPTYVFIEIKIYVCNVIKLHITKVFVFIKYMHIYYGGTNNIMQSIVIYVQNVKFRSHPSYICVIFVSLYI